MSSIHVQIVTFNSEQTIETCLHSLWSQENVDFSVCVIDNASTDDTIAKVTAFGDIPVISNTENIGYSRAHNQALELCDSDYVLTLNPDVTLTSYFLWNLKQSLDADPDVGSASGCLLRVDDLEHPPYGIDSTGLFIRPNRRQGIRGEGLPVNQAPTESNLIFGPDGAAAFYRRAMLEDIRVNGEIFDPDFFMHKEDIDLCWRAQLRGWKSLYVPNAIAYHIRSFRPGNRKKMSDSLKCYATRNRYLLMLKNEIPIHYLRNIIPILFYDLMIFGYVLTRERSSFSAYKSLWQLRKKMLAKRRIIQQSRKVDWKYIRQVFGGDL